MGNPGPRQRGALAGTIPTLAIALLFAIGGTTATATATDVVTSLALVALIAVVAGWVAGPLAAGESRRLLVAALGYAIALIAATASLSIVQGVGDAIGVDGIDAVSILAAMAGRAAYATAATLYLILPAIVLGAAWSLAAWELTRLTRSRSG